MAAGMGVEIASWAIEMGEGSGGNYFVNEIGGSVYRGIVLKGDG